MSERPNFLRSLHKLIGILTIVVFLGTGQYMDIRHSHLQGMDNTVRMLYRSTHIYILLSGIINLMLGLYLYEASSGMHRILQIVGSALILLSPFALLVAFASEPQMQDLARPWSRPALYSTLAGALCHLVASLSLKERQQS